ncbi:MAG: metallophosphoesterase, partial [Deltaproteobacteria bacterium]|nr:metallophosphoesterase [Deltaproteobacteria bacterium]
MLIAQITDLHIRAERAYSCGLADTCLYLEAIEEYLFGLSPPLDGLVITGDLADLGELKAYEFVRNVFARWQVPIYAVPGNHDLRGEFLAELSDFCPIKRTDGLLAVANLSYVVNLKGARLVIVDTVEEGKHSGSLKPEAAEWLQEVLSQETEVPTLVFTHHPPFASGLGAMDEPFENSQTFIEILSDSPQNLTLCLGHLHRALT